MGIDLASGCDRCRGWLAPPQEQASLATPGIVAPTLGYLDRPAETTSTRQNPQVADQSKTHTISLVDFWQALRGRDVPLSPQIVEDNDNTPETASTAGGSSIGKEGRKEEV